MSYIFEDYRKQNEDRNYPFKDGSTLSNGDITIPNNLFLDAALYPYGHKGQLFLSRITINLDGSVELAISDGILGEVATAIIEKDEISTLDVIAFEDPYGRAAGVLVTDPPNFNLLNNYATQDHIFEAEQTTFCTRVQLPTFESGVSGFVLDDGSFVSGEVWLIGDKGVQLDIVDDQIVIHVGGDINRIYSECLETGSEDFSEIINAIKNPALKTINGIPCDQYGNFALVLGSQNSETQILRINQTTNGIEITGAI